MLYCDELLRQQLRDLAWLTLPDLDWKHHIQGAECRIGDQRLTLLAGGGVSDSYVWLGLQDDGDMGFAYFTELKRGHGITAQYAKGKHLGHGPVIDPFKYLADGLREAHAQAIA